MKKEAKDQRTDKELKRAISKAFRRIEKMIREEPLPIVYSDTAGVGQESQIAKISSWLFKRRHDDGGSGN
jgi:hypothetical protein